MSKPLKYIAYFRVSTDKQGETGLGLDAQRTAVAKLAKDGEIVAAYQEVESGKRNDRPELAKALAHARRVKAVLVIAKMDRLARNARFLLGLIEDTPEGNILFGDLPHIPTGAMGKFILTQMAAVAELEAGLISERTKAALASRKAAGKALGNMVTLAAHRSRGSQTVALEARRRALNVMPVIEKLRAEGHSSLTALARELTARNVEQKKWDATQVKRVLRSAA